MMKHMTAISRSAGLPSRAQNFDGIFKFLNDLMAVLTQFLVLATDKRDFDEGANA